MVVLFPKVGSIGGQGWGLEGELTHAELGKSADCSGGSMSSTQA